MKLESFITILKLAQNQIKYQVLHCIQLLYLNAHFVIFFG